MKARTAKRVAAMGFSVGVALAVSGSLAPAQAGFFEQLFGVQPAPQPQPYYAVPQPSYPQPDEALPAHHSFHRAHRHMADAKSERQKTTDLMHDASLRPGDAVMTKTGIQVFEGDNAGRHTQDEFVALNDADDLGRKEKAQLAAVDTTRNDPLRHGATMGTLATGRSAAVSTPIVQGHKIIDARGKEVRYVGP